MNRRNRSRRSRSRSSPSSSGETITWRLSSRAARSRVADGPRVEKAAETSPMLARGATVKGQPDPVEDQRELVDPRPACREPQQVPVGTVHDHRGQPNQSCASGLVRDHWLASEQCGPVAEVVCQHRARRPGRFGVVSPVGMCSSPDPSLRSRISSSITACSRWNRSASTLCRSDDQQRVERRTRPSPVL